MGKILAVKGLEVLDSRGNPTVKCILKTDKGVFSSIVPSGASTGAHEAHELRDAGSRYGGKGVQTAVKNVNIILAKTVVGQDPTHQHDIDALMLQKDGTEHKSKLGANAILSVSLAVAQAGAHERGLPLYEYLRLLSGTKKATLPIPQMNIINSGKHAGLENDIQEHMILPTGFKSFSDALRAGTETYHALKSLLKKKYGAQATLLGDEGGFAPPISSIHERLDLIENAISLAGYKGKIKIGLDCASSEFFNGKTYTIGSTSYDSSELTDLYRELAKTYPLATIEDGMSEDDWEGWQHLTKTLGKKIQLVGDDLLVTNIDRIKIALKKNACNALLLKVNQIGTVSESIESAQLCSQNKWNVIVSHRSGESEDSFIADLAVGLASSQSKFGAPARSDRVAKYNRLLEIEQELGSKAVLQTL